jgi:hypothetical protein
MTISNAITHAKINSGSWLPVIGQHSNDGEKRVRKCRVIPFVFVGKGNDEKAVVIISALTQPGHPRQQKQQRFLRRFVVALDRMHGVLQTFGEEVVKSQFDGLVGRGRPGIGSAREDCWEQLRGEPAGFGRPIRHHAGSERSLSIRGVAGVPQPLDLTFVFASFLQLALAVGGLIG